MAYYLVRFAAEGQSPTDAREQVMVEATSISGAQDKADQAAQGRGGGGAVLQLFNETGLVSTRTAQGLWNG